MSQCGPVSLKAALAVWDQSGAVGTHKNREAKAVLFPCAECAGAPTAKMVSDLPPHLSAIKPDPAGKLWKRWPDIISPRVSAPTPPLPGGEQPPKSAVMGANDTLSIISQREYKEKRQPELLWPIIHDANPAFGPNPNIVKSGFPLAIPDIRQFHDVQLDEYRRRGLNWRNWGK